MKRRKPGFGVTQCYYCSDLVDMSRAEQKTIEVESGRSGTSFSLGKNFLGTLTGKTKGPLDVRVHSGRTYYRKKEIWICDECKELESKEYWSKFKLTFFFMVMTFAIIYIYYN